MSFKKTDEECLMHSSRKIMNYDKENEVITDFFGVIKIQRFHKNSKRFFKLSNNFLSHIFGDIKLA